MASAAPRTGPFYGPINPAILGRFEWEGDDPADRDQLQQATIDPQTDRGFFGFQPFNPALLGGFDDDTATTTAATAAQLPTHIAGDVAEEEQDTLDHQSLAPWQLAVSLAAEVEAPAAERTEIRARESARQDGEQGQAPRRRAGTNSAESGAPNNPYASAIEDRQNAMAAAFLVPVNLPSPPAAHDLIFGQRYHVAEETATVIITNQRKLPDVLSGERDCIVCTDTKPVSEFPAAAVTKTCNHAPSTCLVCVATSIRTDLNTRLWNEIRCPECRETLEYDDVQRFADDETKERYQTLTFRTALSLSPTFLWCTSGCGYGQVHEGGAAQPILTCRLCGRRSCFHHGVAWHENLTCDEYDAALLLAADPARFRGSSSRFDGDDAANEQAAERARKQEDADRVLAQGLEAAERRHEREEKERRAREVREAALRRKEEEEASRRTVGTTTKPCPGCEAPIEKNNGCAHMTCIKCRHQFCWGCNAMWKSNHSINCTGGWRR